MRCTCTFSSKSLPLGRKYKYVESSLLVILHYGHSRCGNSSSGNNINRSTCDYTICGRPGKRGRPSSIEIRLFTGVKPFARRAFPFLCQSKSCSGPQRTAAHAAGLVVPYNPLGESCRNARHCSRGIDSVGMYFKTLNPL